MERNIKYFIERKDTHEWYCLNYKGFYGHTFAGIPFGRFPDHEKDWSRIPSEAWSFETRLDAETYLFDVEFLHLIHRDELIVTEHEFV